MMFIDDTKMIYNLNAICRPTPKVILTTQAKLTS